MNKYFLLFITLTFIHTKITKAQITVEIGGQYNDPQFLVEDVLLGSGISASNFSFMGDSIQIGVFESNTSNLGISSGVVLATGDLRLLDPQFNGAINGINVEPDVEDPDLLNVANSVPGLIGQNFSVSNINDVAVLEFDFVATSDTLSFYYAFASREYNAYENTTFNDVFGFFISGPGISGPYFSPPEFPGGSINIAVVPNSSPELPITISSVNNNLNSEYYIDDPIGINDVNGFTVPLEATTLVQCGETYRIRLAIADGSDSGLSSYIFLSANSFSSPEVLISNDIEDLNLTDLEIPCESTVNLSAQLPNLEGFVFSWNTGDTTQNITVGEGQYWLTLTSSQNCSFNSDTISVRYNQPPNIFFSNDLSVCSGDSIVLKAEISGFSPFTYYWSSEEVSDSILVGHGSYSLTVTDGNNCKTTEIAVVQELTRPTALISGEILKCFNSEDELALEFQLTGNPPFILNYGLYEDQYIDTINSLNYVNNVSEIGHYTIYNLEDVLCTGSFSGLGKIDEYSSFSSSIFGNKEICYGEDAVLEIITDEISIPYKVSLTKNNYNITYENVQSNPFYITVTDTALYKVNYIENINGCRSKENFGSAYVSYRELNQPNIIPPLQTSFCKVDSSFQLFSDLEGGFWSGKGVTSNGVFEPVNAADGEGWIFYKYPQNCNEGDSVLLSVGCPYSIYIPESFTPNDDGINDFLQIYGNNIVDFNLNVFDRWGSLIYSTNEISNFWDGTYQGKLVPTGIYPYKIDLYSKNASFHNKNGVINVIY
jgi:gliding motility-associated-like protein